VQRSATREAACRTKSIANLSSGLLFFDRIDGADFLTNENRGAALRTGEEDQFALTITAATPLIS
jgi:hypothetical protein